MCGFCPAKVLFLAAHYAVTMWIFGKFHTSEVLFLFLHLAWGKFIDNNKNEDINVLNKYCNLIVFEFACLHDSEFCANDKWST